MKQADSAINLKYEEPRNRKTSSENLVIVFLLVRDSPFLPTALKTFEIQMNEKAIC